MKLESKTVVVCGIIASAMLTAFARADDEDRISLDRAPAAVQAAVKNVLGKSALSQLSKEDEDSKITYEAEFKIDGVDHSATFGEDGSVLEQETDVKLSALPPAVTAAVAKAEPTGSPKEASQVAAGGKTFYEIDVSVGSVKHELKVALDGTLIASKVEKDDKD